VTGGWKKLHNEELHGLYTSPSIIGGRGRGGRSHVGLIGRRGPPMVIDKKTGAKETKSR
jgi:hypothetical protein